MIEAVPRVAIIGCGLVGQRRARAMARAQLIACADVDRKRAEAVAALATECVAFTDWRELLARADCNIVIIATPHDSLAEIAAAAAASGRHVLVEKPAGRHPSPLPPIPPPAPPAHLTAPL